MFEATFRSSLCVIFIVIFIVLIHSESTCTKDGNSCVFPFIYNGVTFNNCTYYGKTQRWCSTTNDFPNDGSWDYCDCNNNGTSSTTSNNMSNAHYAYTKGALNNGVIETLVVTLVFNDRITDEDSMQIKYSNDTYKNVFDSVSTFFSDSSWNALTYNFTFIETNYISYLSSSTVSTAEIALEAYKFVEEDGYIWCNGICGRNDEYQHNLYRNNGKHFDQLVIIMNARTDIYWSGLATTAHPITWIISTSFTADTIEHEFGHNLGLNHHFTSKYMRINSDFNQDIGEVFDGESRMGGGASVLRYKDNGHFAACAKDWFGWIPDENIIDITIDENSTITDDDIMYYTLYAFDRGDITLDDTKTLLIRLSWCSEHEYYDDLYLNRIYIYYRTAYAGKDSGISIEYCLLKKVPTAESGAYIQSFTYDINGDTFTQSDHYLFVDESYIIQPFMLSLEDTIWSKFINPYLSELNKINVMVTSDGNGWDYCNEDTFECPDNTDVSIDIAIQFISDSNKDNEFVDYDMKCNRNMKQLIHMEKSEEYKIIRVFSNELGSYGRGESTFTIQPNNTHIKAYIFDKYPNNIPNTIGSVMSFTFIGDMDEQSVMIYPIKAIQIVQNEASSLHIAEIEIYEDINGTKNIAVNNSNINCYSFPEIGTISDTLMDDDLATYSYSKYAQSGAYDACIFEEASNNIKEIKIYPRDAWWGRSSNLTVHMYAQAFEGSTYNHNAFEFTDLLFTMDITHQDTGYYGKWNGKHEIITIPTLNKIITDIDQNVDAVVVPFIHGEFYILLKRLDFDDDSDEITIDFHLNECIITQCPINTYVNAIDSANNNSYICQRCPHNHYAEIGANTMNDCIQCPFHRELKHQDSSWCSIEECEEVIITHNNGLYNEIDGIYYLFGKQQDDSAVYISSHLHYAIVYDLNGCKRWQIIDLHSNHNDYTSIANTSANTDAIYPFLVETNEWREHGVTHFDDIPNTKIAAIKIIQNANYTKANYNVLSIAEIEMYSISNVDINIAPIYAQCYSFPITPYSVYSRYNGNQENGTISELTDNNLSTTSNDGNLNDYKYCSVSPCYDVCILSEALELDHIIIYPPQNLLRLYRTNDVTVKMYSNYDLDSEDNQVYTVYENRMSITVNTTINITKMIDNEDKALQIQCPNKYLLSSECSVLLNALCSDYGNDYVLRKVFLDPEDSDDFDWVCVHSDILTDDLLNIHHETNNRNYMKTLHTNDVDAILTKCTDDYIVDDVVSDCYINDIRVNMSSLQNSSLSANHDILCRLKTYNSKGYELYFNNLLWSVQLTLTSNNHYFYPKKGETYINSTDKRVWTKLRIPKCDSLWTVSLVFDQSVIGGNRFEIWSKSIHIMHDDEYDDTECIEFNCNHISSLVYNNHFNENFFKFVDVSKDILLKCTKDNVSTPNSTINIVETIINEQEIYDEKDKDTQWIIGCIIGIIILLLIIALIIYLIRFQRLKLRRLHRNISLSVGGYASPKHMRITDTVQYVSESDTP